MVGHPEVILKGASGKLEGHFKAKQLKLVLMGSIRAALLVGTDLLAA